MRMTGSMPCVGYLDRSFPRRSVHAHRSGDERKGGSGKTTTTISLAAVLAERGIRSLVVDLDPQASASLWLGRGREPGLYRALAEKRDLAP
jgi:hypothetical protein